VRSITGRSVRTGDLLPSGVALVTARVRLPAGAPPAGESRSVTLACPAGRKVAGFQSPEQRFPMTYGFQPDTVIGSSTRARIVFGRAVLPRDYDVTVGAFCAKPDADGSLVADPRETQPRRAGRPRLRLDRLHPSRPRQGVCRHGLRGRAAVDPASRRLGRMGANRLGPRNEGLDQGQRALRVAS